jgi:SAM-dependent methyltransferase
MDRYRAANRALWDEWAVINAGSAFYDLESFKQGGVVLEPHEIAEVGDVAGKSLLHLQCHIGTDTLSWARLGARVTGVDFSERAVDVAESLSAALSIDARFVCADVLDLPAALDGEFDIVYTSRGVLGWLPDLRQWARVIAHFLEPGGFFYMTEQHPILYPWDDGDDATDLRLRHPYFERADPLPFPVRGSYADRAARVTQTVQYSWPHSMGEIVTAIAAAGLRIDFLHEFPFLFFPMLPFLERRADGHWWLPAGRPGELPLSFSLKATKPGT